MVSLDPGKCHLPQIGSASCVAVGWLDFASLRNDAGATAFSVIFRRRHHSLRGGLVRKLRMMIGVRYTDGTTRATPPQA
jgi:hypothetical protein